MRPCLRLRALMLFPGHSVTQEAFFLAGGEVPVRGGADLAQPRLRYHVAEAERGLEQAGLALPAAGLARDPLIQAVHPVIEHGDPVQVQAAQQRADDR